LDSHMVGGALALEWKVLFGIHDVVLGEVARSEIAATCLRDIFVYRNTDRPD